MKLSKILNHEFNVALSNLTTQKMPLKSTFKVKSISNAIKGAKKNYEDCRIEICERLADKGEDGKYLTEGNQYKMSEENKQQLNQELNELGEVDVNLPATLSVDELESVLLSEKDLTQLEEIITP